MDKATEYMLEVHIGKTRHPMDKKLNVMLIRGSKPEDRLEVIRAIMRAHKEWLNYLTVTQRQWQGHTRNPNKTLTAHSIGGEIVWKFDPSKISAREKFVRCYGV